MPKRRSCGHCEQPQRGFASLTRDGATVPLCHPDEGLDCYRLVTVYQHPMPCNPCSLRIAQRVADLEPMPGPTVDVREFLDRLAR